MAKIRSTTEMSLLRLSIFHCSMWYSHVYGNPKYIPLELGEKILFQFNGHGCVIVCKVLFADT